MSSEILKRIEKWQTRLEQERRARALLAAHAAPPVTDLGFRKESHDAVVLQGNLSGAPVFLKHYLTNHGSKSVRNSLAETKRVQAQMDGVRAGLVEIVWASQDCAMVLMAAAPGVSMVDVLSSQQDARVMSGAAHWLKRYLGPSVFYDRFSPSYWIKKRAAQDISGLSVEDRALFAKGLDVQRARHNAHGNMAATKGALPKDFAPHNLHWTGEGVWGFDIEGHTIGPVARSIARFCVLFERRLPKQGERRFGVNAMCLDAFQAEIDLSFDAEGLMPFLILDEMMQSLTTRHDDPVAGRATRAMMHAHFALS